MLRKAGTCAIFACFFVALGSLLPQLTSSESTARAAPATPSETIKTLSVKVQRLQTAVSGLKIAVNQTLTRRLRALDYQLATVCSQRTVVTRIYQSSNGQVTARMVSC
jgi:hypothetical protein